MPSMPLICWAMTTSNSCSWDSMALLFLHPPPFPSWESSWREIWIMDPWISYVQQQDTPEARYPMVSDSPPITTRPYYNQQGTSQDHDGISFTILDDSCSNSVQQFDAVQDKITHLPGSPSTTLKHSFPPALVQSGWNIYHLQTGLQLPA